MTMAKPSGKTQIFIMTATKLGKSSWSLSSKTAQHFLSILYHDRQNSDILGLVYASTFSDDKVSDEDLSTCALSYD